MGIMQRLLFILLVIFCTGIKSEAHGATLIMMEQEFCEYCDAWNADVGVIYNKTPEGKKAPLRRVDIHDNRPNDLEFITGVVFTPTFVLVEDGKEIGRIRGYPGEDFFWGLLQMLIKKLPVEEKHSMNKTTNSHQAQYRISGRALITEGAYE